MATSKTVVSTSPYLSDWLTWLDQAGKSKSTQNAYRRAVQHFVAWHNNSYGDQFTPANVIARDLRDWQSYQQSVEKSAPATINQRIVGLNAFFQWLLENELVSHNPIAGLSAMPQTKRQPQSLTRKQLRRLLKAVHQSGELRDIAIVELLAGAGLRVSELLALQLGDVIVRERSGWVTVREGKRGNYRQIPLTQDVRVSVVAWLEQHPLYRKEDTNDMSAPLWVGKYGAVTHRSSISRLLEKYALPARLESISPHILRHTFATLYLQANPDDLRGLAALLGHRSLNTVLLYTEPSLDDLTQRMERIDHDSSNH